MKRRYVFSSLCYNRPIRSYHFHIPLNSIFHHIISTMSTKIRSRWRWKKGKIIRQLERENELLKARIEELEKLITFYENAHTPLSLRRGFCGGTNGNDLGKSGGGKPGRKNGHRGVNRPQPEPQPVIVTKFKIAHYAYPWCHREVIATHQDLSQGGWIW